MQQKGNDKKASSKQQNKTKKLLGNTAATITHLQPRTTTPSSRNKKEIIKKGRRSKKKYITLAKEAPKATHLETDSAGKLRPRTTHYTAHQHWAFAFSALSIFWHAAMAATLANQLCGSYYRSL